MSIEWAIIATLTTWLGSVWLVLTVWTRTDLVGKEDVAFVMLLAPPLCALTIFLLAWEAMKRCAALAKKKLRT